MKRQARLPAGPWAPGSRARGFADNSAVSVGDGHCPVPRGDAFVDGSDDGEEDYRDRLRAEDEAEIALAEARRELLDPPHVRFVTSPFFVGGKLHYYWCTYELNRSIIFVFQVSLAFLTVFFHEKHS